jgi:hypothetical protein
MARAKSISIPVTGNTAPLRKALKDAQKELTLFGKAQQKWASASGLAYSIAGAQAVQFVGDTIKAASDLQEATAKSEQVFRGSAAEIEKWAETASSAFGQSKTQALEAAGTFGNLLRAFGSTATEAATMSTRLVELASDLASFNNTPVDEALNALRSGLSGEAEPLKRFGVALQDTRLKQEAMNLGLIETTTAVLPPAIKAQAAYSLILKDTALAQGDFERTQNGLANSTKTLQARYKDLTTELGQAFIPVAETLVTTLNNAAEATQKYENPVAGLLSITSDFTDGLFNTIYSVTGLDSVLNEVETTFRMLTDTEYDQKQQVAELANTYADLSYILREQYKDWDAINPYIEKNAQAAREAADAYDDLMASIAQSEFDLIVDSMKKQVAALEDVAEQQKRNREEAAKTAAEEKKEAAAARQAYRQRAQDLRKTLGEALKDAKENLAEARQAADEFGQSLANSFGVSLSAAYSDAKNAEDNYTEALKARKEAYSKLDDIKAAQALYDEAAARGENTKELAKQLPTLDDYLKALKDVQTAEEGVTTAQKARVAPAAAFAEQIAAAKTFGTNLQTLVGQGLGKAGLQQLLDLGPTVGAEVTKEILAGTAGFTVGGLNESLSALQGVQAGLAAGVTAALAPTADINAAQAQVDALSSASIGAPGVGQGMTIVVNAGVGDPVAIGAQVKSVLQSYDQRAGKLTVQGPKKKAKKK